MRQLVTEYRAGFTHGLVVGVAAGVSVVATFLFLGKFWL